MKIKVKRLVEIDVSVVTMILPLTNNVDIPEGFPFLVGDKLELNVNVETGKIANWPESYGKSSIWMKVRDEGIYRLYGHDDDQIGLKMVASIEQDYVPHGLVPGEYGDYVDLTIDTNGVITNWPKDPDFSAFFPDQDD